MATIEERVSRFEGGYDHLATKTDVASLKGWMMGLMLAVVVSMFLSAATLIIHLLT